MPIPREMLDEIHRLLRSTNQWFDISEIQRRQPELFATEYIQKPTGKIFAVPHQPDDVRRSLEDCAARLLERELRSYEVQIGDLYSSNSVVPSPEDDSWAVNELTKYIESSVNELSGKISAFTKSDLDQWTKPWSKLDESGKRVASELSVTLRLAGEIARLELVEGGHESFDSTGYSQFKIERFYSHFSRVPHPFDATQALSFSREELSRSVRLLVYVVFCDVKEPRLSGFERKFVSAFLRYLNCPRDSTASTIEQLALCFEPFLKKLSFVFDIRSVDGVPIWPSGLDGLIGGLNLTSSDLKETDAHYWQDRSTEDAVFRLSYQLRHKGAHEAHDYPYYERERNAYFIFATLLISCKLLLDTRPRLAEAIANKDAVDTVRDLFVKIEELDQGPDGPRDSNKPSAIPNRLQKLIALSRRAQAIWPTCSTALSEGLQSEYLSVKYELTEADRQADMEAYFEDMKSLHEN